MSQLTDYANQPQAQYLVQYTEYSAKTIHLGDIRQILAVRNNADVENVSFYNVRLTIY